MFDNTSPYTLRTENTERNLRRSDERHEEYSELSDEALHTRAMDKPQSAEDAVFDSLQNEFLWRAIQSLPEMQRRRFILHHEFGLTYKQIALVEGCTRQAITLSVENAVAKIRAEIKKFEK